MIPTIFIHTKDVNRLRHSKDEKFMQIVVKFLIISTFLLWPHNAFTRTIGGRVSKTAGLDYGLSRSQHKGQSGNHVGTSTSKVVQFTTPSGPRHPDKTAKTAQPQERSQPVQVATTSTTAALMAAQSAIGDITSSDADKKKIVKLHLQMPSRNEPNAKAKRIVHVNTYANQYKDAGALTVFVGDGAGEVVVNPETFNKEFSNKAFSEENYEYFPGNIEHPEQYRYESAPLDTLLLTLPLYQPNATDLENVRSIMHAVGQDRERGTINRIVKIGQHHIYLTAEHVVSGLNYEIGSSINLWNLVKPLESNYPVTHLLVNRIEKHASSDSAFVFATPQQTLKDIQKQYWKRFRDKNYRPLDLIVKSGDSIEVAALAPRAPQIGDSFFFFTRPMLRPDGLGYLGGKTIIGKVTALRTIEQATDIRSLTKSENNPTSFYKSNIDVLPGWSGTAAFLVDTSPPQIFGIASHMMLVDGKGNFVKASALREAAMKAIHSE